MAVAPNKTANNPQAVFWPVKRDPKKMALLLRRLMENEGPSSSKLARGLRKFATSVWDVPIRAGV
jgi:hypothetical protein